MQGERRLEVYRRPPGVSIQSTPPVPGYGSLSSPSRCVCLVSTCCSGVCKGIIITCVKCLDATLTFRNICAYEGGKYPCLPCENIYNGLCLTYLVCAQKERNKQTKKQKKQKEHFFRNFILIFAHLPVSLYITH